MRTHRTVLAAGAAGAIAVVITLGSIGSAAIAAAPTWTTPADISHEVYKGVPQVAIDPTGLATSVWVNRKNSDVLVQSSTYQNAGPWSTPVDVSLPGHDASDVQVAVSDTGLATAIWKRGNGVDTVIQSSTSQSGGPWSLPVEISSAGGNAREPRVFASASGLATAVWLFDDGADLLVQSSYSLGGAAWAQARTVSLAGGNADTPEITVSATGLATAIWSRWDGLNWIIQASTSQSGGAWALPADLSLPGEDASGQQVASSQTGLVNAVWQRFDGANLRIQASSARGAGGFTPPEDISLPGADAGDAQIAIDASDLVTAVWERGNDAIRNVQASRRQNGGPWATPIDLTQVDGLAFFPEVVVDLAGNVTATWLRGDVESVIVQASSLAKGGAWSPPTYVSSPTGAVDYQDIAASPSGLVVAVWGRYDLPDDTVQASFLTAVPEAAPPALASTGATANVLGMTVSGSAFALLSGLGLVWRARRKTSVG